MSMVDFSILKEFEELLGDEGKEGVRELVDIYLEDGVTQIQQMKTSLTDKDMETFRRLAHTLKSSSANVGALELQSLCEDIEKKTIDQEMADMNNLVTRVESQFETVKKELTQWMSAS